MSLHSDPETAQGSFPQTPQGRRWAWGLLFVVWTLIALMFVAPTYLQYVADGVAVPWQRLLSSLSDWYLWALLLPAVIWAAHHFPFERRVWHRRLLLHTLVGLVVSGTYALLLVLKSYLINAVATGDFVPHLLFMGPDYLFSGLQVYLLIYAAAVSVVHAFNYHRELQERELKASRLQAQLAEARLQVLKMQLDPHFLFNTLHAISALMHRNVDKADRMISLLSDFLRLSLDNAGTQEVSLKEELDFLERYLEIEKTRFGDLTVEISVEPELLDAMVPNMILQPLVENAVRHGTSRSSVPGEIEIRARTHSHRLLELEVQDNGPGLPEGQKEPTRFGVGLSNTKARLAQLYGKSQRFEVGNGEGGGFRVTLTFPYRQSTSSPAAGTEPQETKGSTDGPTLRAPVGDAPSTS